MTTPCILPIPSSPFMLGPRLTAARVDLQSSRHLSRLVEARNGMCYGNAVKALMNVRVRRAVYVEGFVVSHQGCTRPLMHAWIELPDGTVLDPTPCYCKPGTPKRSYIRAFRWTRAQCLRLMRLPDAKWGFHLQLPDQGRGDPCWVAALWSAHRTSFLLHER